MASLALYAMHVLGEKGEKKLPHDLDESKEKISRVIPKEIVSNISWEEVDRYRKVRNWIAHDGALLSYSEEIEGTKRKQAAIGREKLIKELVSTDNARFFSFDLEPWDEGGATGYVLFEHSFVVRSFQLYRQVITEIFKELSAKEKK